MKRLVATVVGLLSLSAGALWPQTPGVPPVEACKPGGFTIVGYPDEIGPRRTSEFTVFIDKRFQGQFLTTERIWVPAINNAVETWNGISGSTWKYVNQGLTSKDASAVDGLVTISSCGFLFPCSPVPTPPDTIDDPMLPDDVVPNGQIAAQQLTLAVTLISADRTIGQAVVDSDVFFNPLGPFQTEPNQGQIDFESVLVHELGHALGLGHNDNCVTGPTVMESVIDINERRRSLFAAENEGVRFLYPDDSSPAIRISENDRTLRFEAVEGRLPPFGQEIAVYGLRGQRWVTSVTTSAGGNWVVLDPPTGVFVVNNSLEVSVDSTALPAGSYSATLAIGAEGHPGPPANVEIELKVAPAITSQELPFFGKEGIVNGANLTSPSIAPGGLVTIFGTALASTTAQAAAFPLPTNLGGTEVVVNGRRAALLFVSPGQINLQAPPETFNGRGGVIVRTSLGQTLTIPLTLLEAAPQLFLMEGGHAIVLNRDFTLNSPQNPAAQGSKISIFFTGQGAVDPPVASGQPAPFNPLARVTSPAQVQIGGQSVEILFLGLTPGFAGLAQADVLAPSGFGGELPMHITIADQISNTALVSVR